MMMIIFFMFFSGLMMFCSLRSHLLIVLFSLEFLTITLFFMFFVFLLKFGFELYYSLIFLVFSVCEGALGLGILVNIIRSHGNDLLMSMSTLSW
uniref:NADH dehydrogenase subunit 4L n=1 Tax=Ninus insignis TaxID=2813438 RepID=UPI002008ED35|nr:NADH dehydrogenase subunit 4L [Ninus insignis]UPI55269.1 NADH dehydrogenase subunit 4L [Ninus insignis]